MQQPARHLVILVPGFMASVLQKDGRDLWAFSGGAFRSWITGMGSSLDALAVSEDDGRLLPPDDGVTATRLVENLSIPGLFSRTDYRPLLHRLAAQQDSAIGTPQHAQMGTSVFAFPYDWRRDVRAGARQLQRFIADELPRWRAFSGQPAARVILVAYSIGALLARYYIEALGGWQVCHALLSIAPAYGGILGALDVLSNGLPRVPVAALTRALRSWTGLYQLLPTEPVVRIGDAFVRPHETDAIPYVDQQRALAAQAMRTELAAAAAANRRHPDYRVAHQSWVGVGQSTPLSAEVERGRLRVRPAAPPHLDPALADGDGTLALFAIRLSGDDPDQHVPISATHTTIVQHKQVIDAIAAFCAGADRFASLYQALERARTSELRASEQLVASLAQDRAVAHSPQAGALRTAHEQLAARLAQASAAQDVALTEDLTALAAMLDAALRAEQAGRLARRDGKIEHALLDLGQLPGVESGDPSLGQIETILASVLAEAHGSGGARGIVI